MTDFANLISQAKLMQEKMKQTQETLKKIEVEGESGGGSIKITMNGDGELKKIFIDENLFKETKEIIEDLIVAAHNDAKLKLKKKHQKRYLRLQVGLIYLLDLNFHFRQNDF